MEKKKAIITGIAGQDGSYLAELLLLMDYEVVGVKKRSTSDKNIEHFKNRIRIEEVDITEFNEITKLIREEKPDEFYNLAAQSHVGYSFNNPINTMNVTGMPVLYMLEAIKHYSKNTRFYQASTSEMFGGLDRKKCISLNEETPFYPRSPYGVAKLMAHNLVVNYREAYNIFGCCGILFNHESSRRGGDFVTKKIIDGICRYKLSVMRTVNNYQYETLKLGNIYAKRDWGHAGDYVKAMWLMLNAEKADDYVVATGQVYDVKEFVEEVCKQLDIMVEWRGEGLNKKLFDSQNGNIIIEIDKNLYRPAEVEALCGDFSKINKDLGWEPEIDFKNLVLEMLKHKQYEFNNYTNRSQR